MINVLFWPIARVKKGVFDSIQECRPGQRKSLAAKQSALRAFALISSARSFPMPKKRELRGNLFAKTTCKIPFRFLASFPQNEKTRNCATLISCVSRPIILQKGSRRACWKRLPLASRWSPPAGVASPKCFRRLPWIRQPQIPRPNFGKAPTSMCERFRPVSARNF